jgi:hypothetical protein
VSFEELHQGRRGGGGDEEDKIHILYVTKIESG